MLRFCLHWRARALLRTRVRVHVVVVVVRGRLGPHAARSVHVARRVAIGYAANELHRAARKAIQVLFHALLVRGAAAPPPLVAAALRVAAVAAAADEETRLRVQGEDCVLRLDRWTVDGTPLVERTGEALGAADAGFVAELLFALHPHVARPAWRGILETATRLRPNGVLGPRVTEVLARHALKLTMLPLG